MNTQTVFLPSTRTIHPPPLDGSLPLSTILYIHTYTLAFTAGPMYSIAILPLYAIYTLLPNSAQRGLYIYAIHKGSAFALHHYKYHYGASEAK